MTDDKIKENEETKKKVVKKKSKKKKLNPQSRQLYWILGSMVAIIIIIVAVSYILTHLESRSFTYKGLTFTKEMFGKIPVYNYYYYFDNINGGLIKYNLYLREDPRDNNVPVTGDGIVFRQGLHAYIGVYATNVSKCEFALRDIGSLTSFLADNQINFTYGVADRYDAANLNSTYVTCDLHPGHPTIILKTGNESNIDVNGFCTTITFGISNNTCDSLQPIEKFEVQSILDARAAGENNSISSDSTNYNSANYIDNFNSS